MIDNELGVAAEKIGKRLLSVWTIEDIVLFHFHPRQLAAFCAERVAPASELFFLGEQILASGEPLSLRYNFRLVSLALL